MVVQLAGCLSQAVSRLFDRQGFDLERIQDLSPQGVGDDFERFAVFDAVLGSTPVKGLFKQKTTIFFCLIFSQHFLDFQQL